MSNNYENDLQKEIADQMPFISELMQTEIVAFEYTDTKFESSFGMLVKSKEEGGRGYKQIRRLRRDGNCFYRAFLFQLFEHYALNM
jgi:ubiquitin thioesterase protein OTUB1